ncbi:MAG TPA: hypothetical protein EYP53_00035 [Candidatus Latescibacteria bacterium]|nr:hypothetical protein [Candidatus Latescibacterota bacterium]
MPRKRRHLTFGLLSLYVLVWLLTALTVIFLHVSNIRMIRVYKTALARAEEGLGPGFGGPARASELIKVRDKFDLELSLITKVLNKRLLWAPKLNEISNHLPEKVWINRIYTANIGRHSAGEPFRALVIEGSLLATPGEDPSDTINLYISRLSSSPLFMKGIGKVELASIGQKKGSQEVRNFRLLCRLSEGKGTL